MERRIDLDKPRFDQSTYWGRLKHFSSITDPRTLLASDKELIDAKELVNQYKNGQIQVDDPEKLWEAKNLIDSTIHPDTGEKIALPFRMASFVPTNVIIVAGMLVPNPSTAAIMFWQWVNQSANVAFNFFNANKTTTMSTTETATAYTMAVASSCGIAVGMTKWVNGLKITSPLMKTVLQRSVPFTAVAAAGTLNVFLMRQKELTQGIKIEDEHGHPLGKSTNAGWTALSQVAASRVATAFPVVFLPGLIMSLLEKSSLLKRFPKLYMSMNLATITGSLLLALPCAIAIFPQKASISVDKLEPELQQLKDKDRKPLKTVYFNRGL